MKRIGLILLAFLIASCSGSKHSEQTQGLVIEPKTFDELKGFEADNFEKAGEAFMLSCLAVQKNPKVLSSAAIKINEKTYFESCKKFEHLKVKNGEAFKVFLKNNFTPYLVTYNGSEQGKFTSYYEAELKASKTKHDQYKYPIYGKPKDLIEINLKDFDSSLPNKRILGRVESGKLIPYYTREQIEKSGIDAPVILWGDDKVDIFLMQIQGSAVALLDDGTSVRVSYADNNGHRFVGIGGLLLKKGLLKPGEASMDKIRDWLKKNPNIADVNMNENPRFIFHKISDAKGPIGALGVPLTAGRSLAVDPDFIPLGSLLWLETFESSSTNLKKLVSAQDIGAAIKGAVRGDYFWGHGEEALLEAGKMNEDGKFYILLPKK